MKVGDAVSFTRSHADYLHSVASWPTTAVVGYQTRQPVHHLQVRGVVLDIKEDTVLEGNDIITVSWKKPGLLVRMNSDEGIKPTFFTSTKHFRDNLIVRS